MTNQRIVGVFVVIAILTTLIPCGIVQAQPIAIQPVDLIPPGESRLSGGVTIEKERSLAETPSGSQIEYDNNRFEAIDLRMGILDNAELTMGVTYSENSPVSGGAGSPSNGGIEGVRLGTKLRFHPNVSTQLTGKFSGASDVHPYGSDNPSFSINVPVQFELGNGMFHSEAGLTLQSGDAVDGSGNRIGSWQEYANYGIGYSYESNYFTDISMEVVGHTATASSSTVDFNNHLSLLLGADIRLARGVHVKPSTGFALMEGSPNVQFGLSYEIAFEGRHFRRVEKEPTEERYSTREPVGGEPKTQRKTTDRKMDSKATKEMQTKEKMEGPTDKQKVDAHMQKGYRAAEKGNLQQALKHYRAALEINPNSLLVQSNLGSLYYRMGNYQKARDHYRKAVNINPNDTFSLLYLGASHYQLGNSETARKYFQRVKRLDPDNQRVKQWLEKMR